MVKMMVYAFLALALTLKSGLSARNTNFPANNYTSQRSNVSEVEQYDNLFPPPKLGDVVLNHLWHMAKVSKTSVDGIMNEVRGTWNGEVPEDVFDGTMPPVYSPTPSTLFKIWLAAKTASDPPTTPATTTRAPTTPMPSHNPAADLHYKTVGVFAGILGSCLLGSCLVFAYIIKINTAYDEEKASPKAALNHQHQEKAKNPGELLPLVSFPAPAVESASSLEDLVPNPTKELPVTNGKIEVVADVHSSVE